MENNKDINIFELNIDEESKSHFSSIAQWANINAIVGFAALAITLVSTFITISTYGSNSSLSGVVVGAAISILLNVTLLAAASNIKKGITQTDQGHFGLGLTKLAGYFKLVGILTIIVLVIFVLVLLIAIMVGAGRSSTF
jgi:hypothetical protein